MARKSETRSVGDFTRIELRFRGELRLTQQDAPSLVVEADEELLPQLHSELQGDTLVLSFGGDWLGRIASGLRALGEIPVYSIGVRELHGVRLSGQGRLKAGAIRAERLELVSSGAGNVQIASLEAGSLSVHISGRGSFELAGRVREQAVFISGSGDYRARELSSERATVHISGHGHATLAVATSLGVTISGYGRVAFAGDPAVTQTVTGSGRVQKRES